MKNGDFEWMGSGEYRNLEWKMGTANGEWKRQWKLGLKIEWKLEFWINNRKWKREMVMVKKQLEWEWGLQMGYGIWNDKVEWRSEIVNGEFGWQFSIWNKELEWEQGKGKQGKWDWKVGNGNLNSD